MSQKTYKINGKPLADRLLSRVAADWSSRVSRAQTPHLEILQVGEHDASEVYIRRKVRACEQVGFTTNQQILAADITLSALLKKIDGLNDDPKITGILIQLPLPPTLDAGIVTARIQPDKDVDALTPTRLGELVTGRFDLMPCTTAGILQLLHENQVQLSGKSVVMVGASALVGKPTAIVLLHHDATVTVCHSETIDLEKHVRDADVLIVAIGNPNVIQANWIQPGCIVIDVGINRSDDGRIIGDVPTEATAARQAYVSVVPGGVGPLTVAHLVNNLYRLYCIQHP